MRNRFAALAALAACACVAQAAPPFVFTTAPRYDPAAWLSNRDRFPAGAKLTLVSGQTRRQLAPGFVASADPAVSFDATKILFAGRRGAGDHWQIWEIELAAGAPRQITAADSDCFRPLYLPDGRVVYSRLSGIEVVPLAGGKPAPLTFAPGQYLTADVLRDGRILFEFAPSRTGPRELFTIYPDGTGVESLRCDHGPDRAEPRQVSSGDVIFRAGRRLARFTSALAAQTEVAHPDLDTAGPVAEVSPGTWIVALRPKANSPFGLSLWTAATRQLAPLESPAGINAVQPAIVQARKAPPEFPSALVATRTTGNLLCLDARASKTPVAGDIREVRISTRDAGGAPLVLGRAPVASDGSFYVEVPADRPLRLELLNGSGGVVRAEQSWFWMRPSEQRVCVGCHAGPERAPENKTPEILRQSTKPVKMLGENGRQP
jgi:hypothetical protein